MSKCAYRLQTVFRTTSEQKYQDNFISAEIQEMYILANTKCPVSVLNLNLLPFLKGKNNLKKMFWKCYYDVISFEVKCNYCS